MPCRIVLFFPLLLAVILPTQAQDAPIPVFFRRSDNAELNDAIRKALSQPPFILSATVTPSTLVIAIPEAVEVEHKRSSTQWAFTAVFSRDGNPLGQSAESCAAAKSSDCTDQLLLDAKSAATPR